MITLTWHSIIRAQERFKWDRDVLMNKALSALNDGIYMLSDETLRDIFLRNVEMSGSLLYLHEGVVFVFDEVRLITVYPITGHGTTKGG